MLKAMVIDVAGSAKAGRRTRQKPGAEVLMPVPEAEAPSDSEAAPSSAGDALVEELDEAPTAASDLIPSHP